MMIILFLGCGGEKTDNRKSDRFEKSLKPAEEIGELERLTQDGRCIYPMFAPGDSIVYFRRLLATDEQAAVGKEVKELVKPFGLNIYTKELFSLSSDYKYLHPDFMEQSKLPMIAGEPSTYGINSPDSEIFAFETMENNLKSKGKIYLSKNDEYRQLTFGNISCLLERFSNNGKYLSGLWGWDPSSILIFDLDTGDIHKIKREGDFLDFLTVFSSDDKMIVFLRSEKLFELDNIAFGDIWLFKFNN